MKLAKFNPHHDRRGRFARRPESAIAADEPSGQKAYEPMGESLGNALLNAFVVIGNNAEIDLGFSLLERLVNAANKVLTLGEQRINPQPYNVPPVGKKIAFAVSIRNLSRNYGGTTMAGGGTPETEPYSYVSGVFLDTYDGIPKRKLYGYLVHEIGHMIDVVLSSNEKNSGLMASKMGNPGDDFMGVLRAIAESKTVVDFATASKELEDRFYADKISEDAYISAFDGEVTFSRKDDPEQHWDFVTKIVNHNSYLMETHECFARAFEQWFYLRTGDKTSPLYRDAKKVKRIGNMEFSQYPVWPDDEFEPIAKAMDALFRSRKMLKI